MRLTPTNTLLLFLPTLACGGAERVALALISTFRRHGHDARLVVATRSGEFGENLPPDIQPIDLNCEKPIRGIRELGRLAHQIRPVAVICFGMHTGIAAAISQSIFRWNSRLLIRNENNLASEWSQADFPNRTIGPFLSRWSARRGTVIAVSNSLKSATASYLGLPEDEVVAIPNPLCVEPQRDQPDPDVLHPWLRNQDMPTLVSAGRLEPQKGYDTLIRAFSLAQTRCPSRLVIFGNGSLRSKLEAQIRAFGLENRVALPGFTSSIVQQMSAATAFVLSSRYEGFGLVLIEALAAGTQVISTNCPYGPAEILEGGRYGTLVPVDDAESMAAAIADVLSGHTKKQRPGPAWFAQFSADTVAARHLALAGQGRLSGRVT